MKKLTILSLLIGALLFFTACKTPKIENSHSFIQSITISTDSSSVNPMMSSDSLRSLTLFEVGSTIPIGEKQIKVTKAKFDYVVEIIKDVNLSSLKEIKLSPPRVGGSSKSVAIKTKKQIYYFYDNNHQDYPKLIAQLIARIYSLKKNNHEVNSSSKEKQELSKSKDWVWAGDTGNGAIALKKDGSFWQFGKVEFNWGAITPIFTGKKKKTFIYHLKPKKIADGFKNAKIIHGGYILYAIKTDGTLWVWKRGSYDRFIQLTSTHDWLTAGSGYEGNGCDAKEVGLKKDGSLWNLYESNKIKKIGTHKGFTKVAFGCSRIYAQKKDGTVFESYWKDDENLGLRKLIKNKKGADVYEKEALVELARLKSGVGGNHADTAQYGKLSSEIKIRKDGTLWLMPEVKMKNM
ncbi:Regulator of chromosome condensation RCC1 family protein [hydrothermal vent metagenome]|uniref:Regulator of chromosome condensation RCC1 family protein n=1 Tax=hydrothermal vent metagenome TaxID=652676 RepID=A0A1W1CZB3_9ZZZZ